MRRALSCAAILTPIISFDIVHHGKTYIRNRIRNHCYVASNKWGKGCVKRNNESTGKERLSSEGQIVKILMKKQPVDKKKLSEQLKLSRTQLWRTLTLLERERIIRETPKGFVLFSFDDLEVDISVALREFASKGYEAVGIFDLANSVGQPPSLVESPAFKLAKIHGLKIESESRKKSPPVQTFGLKPSEKPDEKTLQKRGGDSIQR